MKKIAVKYCNDGKCKHFYPYRSSSSNDSALYTFYNHLYQNWKKDKIEDKATLHAMKLRHLEYLRELSQYYATFETLIIQY